MDYKLASSASLRACLARPLPAFLRGGYMLSTAAIAASSFCVRSRLLFRKSMLVSSGAAVLSGRHLVEQGEAHVLHGTQSRPFRVCDTAVPTLPLVCPALGTMGVQPLQHTPQRSLHMWYSKYRRVVHSIRQEAPTLLLQLASQAHRVPAPHGPASQPATTLHQHSQAITT